MKSIKIKALALLMVLLAVGIFFVTAAGAEDCGNWGCSWYNGSQYCVPEGGTVCTSTGTKLICQCSGTCSFTYYGTC